MDNKIKEYVKAKLNDSEYQMFCQLETNPSINMYAVANLVIDAYYNGQMASINETRKKLFPHQESDAKKPDNVPSLTPHD